MTLYQPEPVEISTRIRPGEWTEESLTELVASYRTRITEMGAVPADVGTNVQRNGDGSVHVLVTWNKPADAGDEGAATAGPTA